MQFIEFTDPDSGISYQYSEFTIANVAFIINFCSDADVISTLSALGKDHKLYKHLFLLHNQIYGERASRK
ncbi:TPA: hypothetical protein ACU18R_001477 [Mannheimia haemolytica]